MCPMRNILSRLVLLPLFFVVIGCDITSVQDAIDDFDLIIQLEPIDTYVIGQVIDAQTEELIEKEVTVEISGPDAGSIVDFYSDPVTHLNVRGGMLTLGIRAGATPASGAPVDVMLHVSADGYEEALVNVRLEAAGEHPVSVHLVPEHGAVQGRRRAGAQSWLNDGRTAAFALHTEQSEDGASASVSVPADAEVYSATGSPLAGTLTTELTYFSTGAREAMAAFPGGFQGVRVKNGAATTAAAMVTAGFVNLSARSSDGTAAARFGQDLERVIDIAPGTINPNTGSPYAAGDVLDVMQFDREAGAWQRVAEATLVASAGKQAGGLAAWYAAPQTGFQALATVLPTCEVELEVRRNGHRGALKGRLSGTSGAGYQRQVTVPAGNDRISLGGLPAGVQLELELEMPSGGRVTWQFTPSCGGREVIHLPPPPAPAVDVSFSVDLSCTLKLQPPFNATLNYKRRGTPGGGTSAGIPSWTTDAQGRVTGGTLDIPGMYLDETYRFILITPEETAWEDVTITATEMHYEVDIPRDLCRK